MTTVQKHKWHFCAVTNKQLQLKTDITFSSFCQFFLPSYHWSVINTTDEIEQVGGNDLNKAPQVQGHKNEDRKDIRHEDDQLYTGSVCVTRRSRRSRRCLEHHESPNTPITADLTQAAATVDGAYIENLKSAPAKPLTITLDSYIPTS